MLTDNEIRKYDSPKNWPQKRLLLTDRGGCSAGAECGAGCSAIATRPACAANDDSQVSRYESQSGARRARQARRASRSWRVAGA